MASLEVVHECQDTIDELKTLCETTHESHRDLLIKLADSFDGIFENIVMHPNSWKALNVDLAGLTNDIRKMIENVKRLESLMVNK